MQINAFYSPQSRNSVGLIIGLHTKLNLEERATKMLRKGSFLHTVAVPLSSRPIGVACFGGTCWNEANDRSMQLLVC